MNTSEVSAAVKLIGEGFRQLLKEVEPLDIEAREHTPERISGALISILDGYMYTTDYVMKEFEHVQSDDLVVVKDIPFYSLCKHHILPFFGKAHVGYLPNEKVLGLSKIPRIVGIFSHRLQLQEKLGREICDCLHKAPLKPRGVIVVLEAQHMCMQMRGIQSVGSITITASLAGNFEDNSELKREFYHLIGRNSL